MNLDLLMVSASRITAISSLYRISAVTRWIILVISLLVFCGSIIFINSLSFNSAKAKKITTKHEIEILVTFFTSLILLVMSTVICFIPEHHNVNSNNYFVEPYGKTVQDTEINDTAYRTAPITIAHRYQHNKFGYEQATDLVYKDISSSNSHMPKSLIIKYKHNADRANIKRRIIKLSLQKYQVYLNNLPAHDVKAPSWWMYL